MAKLNKCIKIKKIKKYKKRGGVGVGHDIHVIKSPVKTLSIFRIINSWQWQMTIRVHKRFVEANR